MKVTIFTDAYLPSKSGLVTMINQLIEILGQNKVSVYLVYPQAGEFFKETENLKHLPIPSLGLFLNGEVRIVKSSSQKQLKQLLDEEVDLVHTHTEGLIGKMGKKFAKENNLPCVHTFHTMWEDYNHYFLSPKIFVRWYLQRFMKGFDAITTPSHKSQNYLNKINVKSQVIFNFLNPKVFDKKNTENLKEKLGIGNKQKVILFVGRLSKEKNLLKLLEDLQSYLQNNDYKLLLVGGGPYLKKIQNKIFKLGLTSQVILTGFVSWREISKYYQIADVYVNYSKTETLSTTALEALFSNIPLVVFKDGGYQGIVEDGLNGFYFSNQKSLEESLDKVLKSTEFKKDLSKKTNHIQKKFSAEKIVEDWMDLYKNLLSS